MAFFVSQGLTQGSFTKSAGYTTPGGFWTLPVIPPALYTMSFPFTFTNMDNTGETGPTAITYGTNTPGYGTSYVLSLTDGSQYWTVPEDKIYTFTVAGAAGGAGGDPGGGRQRPIGGNGAVLMLTKNLIKGTVIKILVGQQGSTPGSGSFGGGGGGGSFVYDYTTSTLIAAAGGGGGGGILFNGSYVSTMDGKNAELGNSGSSGYSNPSGEWLGGSGGSGGSGGGLGSSVYAFAGGGYSGNGAGSGGGLSFLNGGIGGGTRVGVGGFGGGGFGGGFVFSGGQGGGGGGGGYSGGGGGASNKDNLGSGGGGGGGAYDVTGMYSVSATNTGMGYVIVNAM